MIRLALPMLAALSCSAGFIVVPQPTPDYLAATAPLQLSGEDFSLVDTMGDGQLSLSFSSLMILLTTPDNWSTWGVPPDTISSAPRLLWSDLETTVAVAFSTPIQLFGVELQPNDQEPWPMTAFFYSQNTLLGSIHRVVDGDGGALTFAASTNQAFDRVVFESGTSFGMAQFRYALSYDPVPEPSTGLMAAAVLGGAGLFLRRPAAR